MEVAFLGSLAGLLGRTDDGWFCRLEISPLFETIDDLRRSESILEALFSNPCYKSLLAASDNRQEVMLGYSDSAKELGSFASRLLIAQSLARLGRVDKGLGIGKFQIKHVAGHENQG